jgi:hypothetical protein
LKEWKERQQKIGLLTESQQEDNKNWTKMKSKYEAARKKATRRQCIRQLKQIWPIIFILILAVILMIYKLF